MLHITITKRAALIIVVGLALVLPGSALASHVFNDVDDANVHAPGIEWLAGSGVTAGCEDGTVYCPNDPVTRAQMATFMHRLSGRSGVAPSVNADMLDGMDSVDFLRGQEGALGYVWACDPAVATYEPAGNCGGWAENSAGGAMRVDRLAPGEYLVTFFELGTPGGSGGNVQVSAYGGTPAHCQVEGWLNDVDVTIGVFCFDLAGVPSDAVFDVLFVW